MTGWRGRIRTLVSWVRAKRLTAKRLAIKLVLLVGLEPTILRDLKPLRIPFRHKSLEDHRGIEPLGSGLKARRWPSLALA